MLICSSCLSDRFFLRFGPGPRGWRELFDLGDLGGWQAGEQIFQVIKRVDPMPAATAQQRINHDAALTETGRSMRMSYFRRALFAPSEGADC